MLKILNDKNIFQWKYRIQAHHKAAADGGAHGEAVALDSQFNGIINEKGAKNTNKAGDLKVEAVNKDWQNRARDLGGNFTPKSLERISK